MNVLVVYGSHLGSTAAIAEVIGDAIRRHTTATVVVEPAATAEGVDGYDAVIIGGGTYAGRWHPDAVKFVRQHENELLRTRVWFFSSGPVGEEATTAKPVAPVELKELSALVGPRTQAIFAGAHDRSDVDESELSRFEKFIAKRFVPEGDWRDWPAIERWARKVAMEIQQATSVGAL